MKKQKPKVGEVYKMGIDPNPVVMNGHVVSGLDNCTFRVVKVEKTVKKYLLMLLFSVFGLSAFGQGYCITRTTSAPITMTGSSGVVIDKKQITGSTSVCIRLVNCHDITIKRCKLTGSTVQAIYLQNCYNITVDSCDFSYVACGVNAFLCTGNIKANNSQFKNMQSVNPALAHAVQYNSCTGSGYEASHNKIESDFSPNTGDLINFYKCSGVASSYMKADSNQILGGGTNYAFGPAGIVLGDISGAYQRAIGNILVNTGYAGIQVQGGNHMTVKGNRIFGAVGITWSGLGLGQTNASPSNPQPSGVGDTVTLNRINWWSGRNVPPTYRIPGRR